MDSLSETENQFARAHPSFAIKFKTGKKGTNIISSNSEPEIDPKKIILSQVAAISNFLLCYLRMSDPENKSRSASTAGEVDEKAMKNLQQVLIGILTCPHLIDIKEALADSGEEGQQRCSFGTHQAWLLSPFRPALQIDCRSLLRPSDSLSDCSRVQTKLSLLCGA